MLTIGCSLHPNKLSARTVFKHLNGSTKSPRIFAGPLEKLYETDHQYLPEVELIQLRGPLDNMTFDEEKLNDPSSDQRLLLKYVLGIARWLTLALSC